MPPLEIPGLDARPTHLTTFTVKADGTALDEGYRIVSIEIRRRVNRVPKATIVLVDGDAAAQTFARSEEDTLVPGVRIEVLGGYSSQETTIFEGVVTRHRIEVAPGGDSRLVIEARDPVFAMTLGRRSRNFTDTTDGEVMETVIGAHAGLTAEVEATGVTHPQIVQHQVSDWDFLVMRAEIAGHVVVATDGVVRVGPPPVAGAAAASALFGQSLFSAEIELDAESQVTAVETAAWDPENQELATAEAEDAATPGPGDLTGADLAGTGGMDTRRRHPGARDQAALDQWAAAEIGRARRAAVRGMLKVQGSAALLPGVLVELGGLGRRFNGLALVSGVRHRLGRGNWLTDVVIGTDPRAHAETFPVAAPPAGGDIPPVRGLQIGIVVALEDPEGAGRIRVRLATISDTDGEVWARHALLDAGDNRGTEFRPEIGDEVVLGFLDDDPRFPVILGALHSGARPPPIAGADDNPEKAIVTRSGMRLHWDDDKAVTTIDTPNGNRVVLSDDEAGITVEDENGNKVTLGPDGVALESAKDVTVKAAGDVTLEGVNISLKASASLKAEGSAGAELGSSANTVVKGSLVQIN